MADHKRPKKRHVTVTGNRTGTGLSINEIALQLKAAKPDMKFSDALDSAKEVKQAQTMLATGGHSIRNKILTGVLGKNLGGSISSSLINKNDRDKAAQILSNHQKTLSAADPSTQLMKTVQDMEEKITFLYKEVKDSKAERMKQPAPASLHSTSQAHQTAKVTQAMTAKVDLNTESFQDAIAALQVLGYKKKESQDLVRNAPPSLDAQGIIKYALKTVNDLKTGKITRIPAAAVPQAVQAARASPVPATVASTPSVASPAAIPAATPVIPTMPAPQMTKNDDQKEAAAIRKAQVEIAREKKQAEWEKSVDARLDKIMDGLMHKNLNQIISDLLEDALAFLGKNILKALVSAGKFVIQNALKVIGKIGSAIKSGGKALWELISGGAEGLAGAVEAGSAVLEATTVGAGAVSIIGAGSMVKDTLEHHKAETDKGDAYLAKYGIKQERNAEGNATTGKYTIGGKSIDKKDLTQAQQDIIDLEGEAIDPSLGRSASEVAAKARIKAHPEQYTKEALAAQASATPASTAADRDGVAQASATPASTADLKGADRDAARAAYYAAHSDTAAAKIVPEKADSAPEQMAPIIVNAPVTNNTTTAPSSGDDAVVIKTRNDESSFAGPTAAMFDHPVSFAGVYSM
jgi:RuvA, C-terminal domain